LKNEESQSKKLLLQTKKELQFKTNIKSGNFNKNILWYRLLYSTGDR